MVAIIRKQTYWCNVLQEQRTFLKHAKIILSSHFCNDYLFYNIQTNRYIKQLSQGHRAKKWLSLGILWASQAEAFLLCLEMTSHPISCLSPSPTLLPVPPLRSLWTILHMAIYPPSHSLVSFLPIWEKTSALYLLSLLSAFMSMTLFISMTKQFRSSSSIFACLWAACSCALSIFSPLTGSLHIYLYWLQI